MRKVIMESPYAGDIARNVAYAKRALRHCIDQMEAPLASHLLYTQILDDSIEWERDLGIEAGLAWASSADAVAFYLDYGMSPGMHKALALANKHRLCVEPRFIGKNSEPGLEPGPEPDSTP